MAVDRTQVKLGKLAYRDDPRTLKLARYIDTAALPAVPTHFGWDTDVHTWPMYLNDRLGDCVVAWMAHHVQLLTAAAGAEADVTDSTVLSVYEQLSGYNPATGANDNGVVMLDALNAWRKTGVGGHRIGSFVEVPKDDHKLVTAACWLFGGLGLGLAMPRAAQDMGQQWKLPHGRTKDPAFAPGSWGGHAVYAVDYTRAGVVVVSWGELITVSWGFWRRYVEEVWAVQSDEFLHGGVSPQGFNRAALLADLAQLGTVH